MSRFDRSSQNFSQNEDRYLTFRTLVLRVRGNLRAYGECDTVAPSVSLLISYRRIWDPEDVTEGDDVDMEQLNDRQTEYDDTDLAFTVVPDPSSNAVPGSSPANTTRFVASSPSSEPPSPSFKPLLPPRPCIPATATGRHHRAPQTRDTEWTRGVVARPNLKTRAPEGEAGRGSRVENRAEIT